MQERSNAGEEQENTQVDAHEEKKEERKGRREKVGQ